jgi:hypothetical protein
VKSHPDVGERWYPDLLAKIRAKEAAMDAAKANGTQGEAAEKRKEVKFGTATADINGCLIAPSS